MRGTPFRLGDLACATLPLQLRSPFIAPRISLTRISDSFKFNYSRTFSVSCQEPVSSRATTGLGAVI